MTLSEKDRLILTAVATRDTTVDEFVTPRGWYVNSWAPSFTHLRKRGLIERTGEKRATSHGAEAFVLRITSAGRTALLMSREVRAAA